MLLLGLDALALDDDLVRGVDLGAQCGDHGAVDGHGAGRDEQATSFRRHRHSRQPRASMGRRRLPAADVTYSRPFPAWVLVRRSAFRPSVRRSPDGVRAWHRTGCGGSRSRAGCPLRIRNGGGWGFPIGRCAVACGTVRHESGLADEDRPPSGGHRAGGARARPIPVALFGRRGRRGSPLFRGRSCCGGRCWR